MGQWGSFHRAMAGQSGVDILLYYYGPAEVVVPQLEPRAYIPLVLR